VLDNQRLIHKQIAHLTITRPLPEETGVYRLSTYLYLMQDIVGLLEQFSAAVDARLLPDWWQEWVAGLSAGLLADT